MKKKLYWIIGVVLIIVIAVSLIYSEYNIEENNKRKAMSLSLISSYRDYADNLTSYSIKFVGFGIGGKTVFVDKDKNIFKFEFSFATDTEPIMIRNYDICFIGKYDDFRILPQLENIYDFYYNDINNSNKVFYQENNNEILMFGSTGHLELSTKEKIPSSSVYDVGFEGMPVGYNIQDFEPNTSNIFPCNFSNPIDVCNSIYCNQFENTTNYLPLSKETCMSIKEECLKNVNNP